MDFALTPRCLEYREKLLAFMDEMIYPNEELYEEQLREAGNPHAQPPHHGRTQEGGSQARAMEPFPTT